MFNRRFILLPALLLALGHQVQAQIRVEMRMHRRLFIVYEPVMVTVGITNLSGHDLALKDVDGQKWFSFQVTGEQGRIIPPLDLDYHLQPLTIPAGETVKRSLNLASLYGVQEFGTYHFKASVYSADTQQYYSSQSGEFEITDGKLMWQQTVGVPAGMPGAGSNRTISLLTHRTEKENMLYIRVEDKEGGVVYTTNPLGRVLLSFDPQIVLDKWNRVHVLQLVGAKTYVYSKIGLNGEWGGQTVYNTVTTRPVLRKKADGSVAVVGGQPDIPVAPAVPSEPKLSDRPPGLPKS